MLSARSLLHKNNRFYSQGAGRLSIAAFLHWINDRRIIVHWRIHSRTDRESGHFFGGLWNQNLFSDFSAKPCFLNRFRQDDGHPVMNGGREFVRLRRDDCTGSEPFIGLALPPAFP
jgi:hypothetical protein